jgi:hypothetical protein
MTMTRLTTRSAPPLGCPEINTVCDGRSGCPDILLQIQVTSNLFLEKSGTVGQVASWSFLTNHGRVLLCIAQNPETRLRDIAADLGITERHAYAIVTDLTGAGYVVKEKDGRRNRYQVQKHLALPDLPDREQAIGEVLDVLTRRRATRKPTGRRA